MPADLGRIDPLVLLGGKLAVLFLLAPSIAILMRAVLGSEREAAIRADDPGRRALVVAIGAGLAAGFLGWDVLDPRLVGAALASNPLARVFVAVACAVLGALPALDEARANRPFPKREGASSIALVVALVVAILPASGVFAMRMTTSLGDDALDAEAIRHAGFRAIVVPTDADAHLALAFAAAGRDDGARTNRELAIARGLHAKRSIVLEIESELAARRGDCRAAVALFNRSLEARIPSDPEEFLNTRLTVGGFHLPPSLVARCDFASGTER